MAQDASKMAEETAKAAQDEAREAKIIEKTRVFQCFLIFGLSSPRCLQKIPAEPQDTPKTPNQVISEDIKNRGGFQCRERGGSRPH